MPVNIPQPRVPVANPQGLIAPDWYRFLVQMLSAITTLTNNASSDVILPSYTVATLPSASLAGPGMKVFVTDATATTFASVVTGGGTNGVPAYSDGTNWRVG